MPPLRPFPTDVCARVAAIAIAAVVAALPIGLAAADKEPARKPIIDPRAEKILRKASDHLEAAKYFTVRADIQFDDVLPTGQKIQYAALERIAVRRPDRAYVEFESDVGDNRLWYDGKRVTVQDGVDNVYASAEMPGKLDGTLDRLLQKHGFTPPLSDFLYSDPYAVLRPRIQFGLYVGLNDVDGVPCHHLAFVDKSIDWQVWIEDGPTPLPRKLVITYTSVSGAPQFEAKLSEWDFAVRPADDVFTVTIPSDATQLEFVDVTRRVEVKQ